MTTETARIHLRRDGPSLGRPLNVSMLVALVFATAVNVLVTMVTPYFPFGDAPNHLARYTLISRYWAGTAPHWVVFHLLPTGYVAVDLLGASLVTVFGPRATMHILAAAYAILLPLGMYRLLRAVNVRLGGWALVGCLLTFNWYFVTGFLSYSLGIPLAFFWLAWWWPRRNGMRATSLAVGSVGIGLLYMVHMSAAVIALAPVAVHAFESSMPDGSVRHINWERLLRQALEGLVLALPGVALFLLMKFSFPPATHEELVFRSPGDKLGHLITPLAVFSAPQLAIFVISYALAIGIAVWYLRKATLRSTWILTAILFCLAYAIFPVFALGAWDVDIRFLLPGFLLVFVNPNQANPLSSRAMTVLAALSVLNAGTIWNYSNTISKQIATVVNLLHTIPAGPNVLYLAPRDGRSYRAGAFMHAGEWLTIDRPGWRVNGLFVGGPNGAYLDHFTEANSIYDPGTFITGVGLEPLQWAMIRQDYKFIVLVADDTSSEYRAVSRGATLVRRTPVAELFQVSADTGITQPSS